MKRVLRHFVSRHDEKWQLFNGVKQNDAKRASCPTLSFDQNINFYTI